MLSDLDALFLFWLMKVLYEFKASANENADGFPIVTFMNTLQGFKCEDSSQTIEGIVCPDVKVRSLC